jgi:hypothetical protein
MLPANRSSHFKEWHHASTSETPTNQQRVGLAEYIHCLRIGTELLTTTYDMCTRV